MTRISTVTVAKHITKALLAGSARTQVEVALQPLYTIDFTLNVFIETYYYLVVYISIKTNG